MKTPNIRNLHKNSISYNGAYCSTSFIHHRCNILQLLNKRFSQPYKSYSVQLNRISFDAPNKSSQTADSSASPVHKPSKVRYNAHGASWQVPLSLPLKIREKYVELFNQLLILKKKEKELTFNQMKEMEESFVKLLDESENVNNRPIYERLFEFYSITANAPAAERAYKRMKRSLKYVKPRTRTYTNLIEAVASSPKLVVEYFEEMKSLKILPHVQATAIYLKSLCKLGNAEKAVQELKTMASENTSRQPDTRLITSLIPLVDAKYATRLFALLQSSGTEIDEVAYSVYINHLCRNGAIHSALETKSELIAKGLTVHNSIYMALISSLSDAKSISKLYKEIQDIQVKLDSPLTRRLIIKFTQNKLYQDLENINSLRLKNGTILDIAAWNMLIKGFFQFDANEAKKLFEEMKSVHKITPNSSSWNILLEYVHCKKDVAYLQQVWDHSINITLLDPKLTQPLKEISKSVL